MTKVSFPPKLSFLFKPMRYKVARGGRGSGKSWSFARALLVQGSAKPLRILCTREIQKSIKDSVHKLLSDQIQVMGLGSFYEVLETEIRGRNGTLFIFAGLAQHTVESIKSYEGIDRVWVEEAQAVTKRSWEILTPTIRKEGSEIWVSFNPELDTDETYVRFVVNPPPDCVSALVNWTDNPWFNDVLEKERQHCKLTAPDDYENIWEGKCRKAVAGAIYAEEMEKAELNGQVCNLPYDPMLKVHIVFDLGWNDTMFITLVQRLRSEVRVIEELVDSHKTLDHYSAILKAKNMNWGKVWLPHDGFSRDYKTGKSTEEILKALGWTVANREEIAELAVEEGIKASRLTFRQVYMDKDKTPQLQQALKRYRRSINRQTQEPGPPLHDEWSHGADNFRYLCINADRMANEYVYNPPRTSQGSWMGR
jgi:phage terminase large subunit